MHFKIDKDKIIVAILLFILFIAIISFTSIYKTKAPGFSQQPSVEQTPETKDTVGESASPVSLTARQFVNDINVGINIGNSLDCCPPTGRNDGSYDTSYYETYWKNPVITDDFIKTIRDSGFNSVRLPVTWFYNTYTNESGKLCIREEWLNRVAEVIDLCLAHDLYVILDSHHDGEILWADMNDIDELSANAKALWQQIAEYFKDYDYRLIFESYNELKTKDNKWQYTNNATEATNILNQLFVETVRNTGSNNSKRILICSTYLNETSDEALDGFILPNDTINNRLAISVHSYNTAYNQDINALFNKLKSFSKKHSAPVLITEFGTTNSFVPFEYRSNHAGNYIACANQYDIKCFWWDDGGEYQIFDRETNTVKEPDIIESLMNPAEFKTKNISTNRFDKIDNYSYACISSTTGLMEDFTTGALTLNLGQKGMPVTYGYGYHINLTSHGEGDGMRLSGLAFYDSHDTLIRNENINLASSYDITPPEAAAFMKITFFNPWGSRTLDEYVSYLESGELYLEITEYLK